MLTQSAWSNGGRTRDRALRNSCWSESNVAYISFSKWLHSSESPHDSNKAISLRNVLLLFGETEQKKKKRQPKNSRGFDQDIAIKGKHLLYISLRSHLWECVHEWIWMAWRIDFIAKGRDITIWKAKLKGESMLTFNKAEYAWICKIIWVVACKFTTGLSISASLFFEWITCLWWHTYPGWRSQSFPACLAPQTASRPTGHRHVWAACSPERSVAMEKGLSAGSILHMATKKLKPVISDVQSCKADRVCPIRWRQ